MACNIPVKTCRFIFDDRTYYVDETTFAADKTQYDYECPVCFLFMQQPVTTCEGKSWTHRLCKGCTYKLIRCPIDKRQIRRKDIKPDPNWITGVKARCPNEGCQQTFPITPTMAEAKEHLAQHCPKQSIECPGQCGEPLTREALAEHKKVCKQHFRCTCEQIFSQKEPLQTFMRHVHDNPERHEYFGLMRYMVNNMGNNTPPSSSSPSLLLAGLECKPHTRGVYQSVSSPQTFFFTVHHCDNGNYERSIYHRGHIGDTCHELQIFVAIAAHTSFHMLTLEFTDSLTSSLESLQLTPYSGQSARAIPSITLGLDHHHCTQPICYNNSRVRMNKRKEYLFKIELGRFSPEGK